MKSFFATVLASTTVAQSLNGTTGHFGNDFGHDGVQDHNPVDHIYGYDSVEVDYYLDTTANTTLKDSIITQVINANDKRVTYLTRVHAKRLRRLDEIHLDNLEKIGAPFDYQVQLLNEEESDIIDARNEAIRSSTDAYDDLLFRLGSFKDDIVAGLEEEKLMIDNAIDRSLVDHKHPCKVLNALRIDWLEAISCPHTDGAVTITNTQVYDFEMYDTLFDDFHYDIGHGAGTGTGSVNTGIVNDGFGPGYGAPRGSRGDSQTQFGSPTHVWEQPGRPSSRF